jgi:hypothetical protein
MSVSDKGRITETVKAPARKPNPVPETWWIGWMAQLDRVNKRGFASEVGKAVAERLEKEREHLDARVENEVHRRMARVESALSMVDQIKETLGIDLYNTQTFQLNRMAKVWKLSQQVNVDLAYVARQLRGVVVLADVLDELDSLQTSDQEHFA